MEHRDRYTGQHCERLAAYGMGLADQNLIREQAFERVLEPEALAPMAQQLDALAEQAVQTLARQQLSQSEVQVRRRAHVRYEGTDAALVVPFGDLPALVAGSSGTSINA